MTEEFPYRNTINTMAVTKAKKNQVLADLTSELKNAKLMVAAKYSGLTVKQLQELRKSAKAEGVSIRVVKNRLVIKSLESIETLKGVDTSALKNQLLYAISTEDEVAPAQVLAKFAKTAKELEFVGAVSSEGNWLSTADVSALASLPSKDALRGQLIATIQAPVSGFVRVLAGNVRGVLNVLNARAEVLGQA
jgi:large subunit ribosomal protein L10